MLPRGHPCCAISAGATPPYAPLEVPEDADESDAWLLRTFATMERRRRATGCGRDSPSLSPHRHLPSATCTDSMEYGWPTLTYARTVQVQTDAGACAPGHGNE